MKSQQIKHLKKRRIKHKNRNSENDKIHIKNENEHPRVLLASGKYHITSHFSENRFQSKNIGIDIIIQFTLHSSFICRRFESHKNTRTNKRTHSERARIHTFIFAGVADDRVLCDLCCLLFFIFVYYVVGFYIRYSKINSTLFAFNEICNVGVYVCVRKHQLLS